MAGAYARKPGYKKNIRPDHISGSSGLFKANRKIIIASQSVCAICGKPVDKSLKYPHPMCATVDHIIPVSKNGDPASLDNLQLAHMMCNRMKSDKLMKEVQKVDQNRKLPLTENWAAY